MSNPTRILTLTLQMPLHPGDIPGLRAAVVELLGREASWFHGHNNDPAATDPFLRSYPLVQYAVRRGLATLVGLGPGAQAIRQQLLPVLPERLFFAGRWHALPGFHLHEEAFSWEWSATPQRLGLVDWLALNADNYAAWKADPRPAARQACLTRALTGQLRALLEACSPLDHKLAVASVERIDAQKKVQWHGTPMVRFAVAAQVNLALPPSIGLGRAAAFGFGQILPEPAYQRWLGHRAQSERGLFSE